MSRRTANPRPKRKVGWSPSPARTALESASRHYLKQSHKAPRGLRTELAYRECLERVTDAHAALREAEAELAAELQKVIAAQELALVKLRAARRRASPLMIGICQMEGFEPATVAAAILPVPIHTHVSDGHPWLPTNSSGHQALGRHFDTCYSDLFRNRVSLRKDPDPRGGLIVMQRGGTLEVQGRIGEAAIATNAGKATLTLTHAVPETVLAAMAGRPISQLVQHPLLADPAYIVTAATQAKGRAVICFVCPNVSCADWEPHGAGPPYLHSDPTLAPWAAMVDLVVRSRTARGRVHAVGPVVELLHAQHHIRKINLSRPPGHQLPTATAAVIASLSGHRIMEVA